jgi:NADH-quinone oxidoreductase subunit F
LAQTLQRIWNKQGREGDLDLLDELCKNIAGRTVCAFGEAEVGPILSTLKYFRHEYEELIREAEATRSRSKEIPVLTH